MRIGDWINRDMGLGLLGSILVCGAGALLGALLMDREILQTEAAGSWMASVWLAAAFLGGRIALRKAEQGRLLRAGVQAMLLYIIVWCAALAVSAVPDFGRCGWYITVGIWGGILLAAVMPCEKKKRRKRQISARKRRGRGQR